MLERWRVIPDIHPLIRYEVSDQGRVRSVWPSGRIILLKLQDNGAGYWKVRLTRQHHRYVHHLVIEAFVGPRPADHDVDHVIHDTSNNALTNLRYRPAPDNRRDIRRRQR